MPYKTREEWLKNAVTIINDEIFSQTEFRRKLPKQLLVSCGFPSRGALAVKKQRIGECWYPKSKEMHNIFISPVLDDPSRVLDVLIHELCHVIAGPKAKHGGQFKRVAMAAGLSGKMTTTVAGPELKPRLNAFCRALGKYPHNPITAAMLARRPKQGTRLLKVICPECEYTCRITQKWIEIGFPTCPCGWEMELG